jgi:hypothetical protein
MSTPEIIAALDAADERMIDLLHRDARAYAAPGTLDRLAWHADMLAAIHAMRDVRNAVFDDMIAAVTRHRTKAPEWVTVY